MNTCPLCESPLDESGDCTQCGYYAGWEPEPLDPADFAAVYAAQTMEVRG